MKTLLIVFISFFYIITTYASNWVNINSENPKPNIVKLISSDLETSVLQFTLEGFYQYEVQTLQGSAFNIRLDDCAPMLISEAPDLCLVATSLIIPDEGKMEIKILSSDYKDFYDIEIAPSKGSILRNVDPASVSYSYGKQYEQNKFFPEDIAGLRKPYILRDHRGQVVLAYPFQYNPVTKTLRVHYNIIIEVKKYNETGINQKHRNKALNKIDVDFNAIYSNHFINYDFISSKYDPLEEEGSMLIISYGNYMDAMQSFVEWKKQKGIHTEIIDIAIIGNDTSDINPYIRDKYYNENLKFVLLVGDYNHITSPMVGQSPGYNEGGADNLFGYIEGDDHYSEVIVGRISAESIADVETQVERSIHYEKEITEADTWLNRGLGIGSNDAGVNYQGYHDWDHIRELIRADLMDYSYVDVDEFYDGSKGGEDLPGDPTSQMLIDKFAEGIGIIVYSGHAGQTSFGTTNFNTSHANLLTNTGMLPHIWVLGCNPGEFNGGYCLAESLARSQHNGEPAGSLTSFMSSTSQNWDPPYLMEEEMVDIITEQKHIKQTAGALAINGCMEMNDYFGEGGFGYFTTDTWVFFGDPSLMVRTDTPVELSLSNQEIYPGVPYTTVISSVNGAIEGAKVCISQDDNYYFGITDETGYVSIENELLPGTALIVVTAYNAKTIFQDITVIPPSGPYVIYHAVEINDETGNDNQLVDYAETIKLSISINNVGVEQADNVIVSISSTDEFVTIIDETENYGNVPAGETVTITDGFELEIDNLIPDEHSVFFDLSATDGSNTWVSSFYLIAHAPLLELSSFVISGNGTIDPGETVDLIITVENSGSSEAFNIFGELSDSDPYLTINTSEADYGNLTGGANTERLFNVTANINTPEGHLVDLLLNMSADLDITGSSTFGIVIGQIPVLILDLDGNGNSAPGMEAALNEMEVAYEKLSSFPTDLSLYSTIFVCLGIYSNNHVLSSYEGQLLADYLNNGGNLYMEGGDTWAFNSQTSVHTMFNINGTDDGSGDMGTINGQSGTFTEGMSFNYSGENSWMDHLEPISTAFVIFENQSPVYGTGIAYDGGSYKTIGTSHEFGGFDDGTSPSTKHELMIEYLNFFGFSQTLMASFTVSTTNTCIEETVNFYDQSTGEVISWEWIFEGGSPSSSSNQNPEVTYSDSGEFDVSLAVSDGVDFNTLTLENYIIVNNYPMIPYTPVGEDIVCTNYIQFSDYTTSGAMYADTYIWEILPAEAGTINGEGTIGTVEWTTNWEGNVMIKVKGYNADCEEGDFSDAIEVECQVCIGTSETNILDFEIFPNPAKDILNIKSDSKITQYRIMNFTGQICEQDNNLNNNEFVIDISQLNTGVYYIILISETDLVYRKKIIKD